METRQFEVITSEKMKLEVQIVLYDMLIRQKQHALERGTLKKTFILHRTILLSDLLSKPNFGIVSPELEKSENDLIW